MVPGLVRRNWWPFSKGLVIQSPRGSLDDLSRYRARSKLRLTSSFLSLLCSLTLSPYVSIANFALSLCAHLLLSTGNYGFKIPSSSGHHHFHISSLIWLFRPGVPTRSVFSAVRPCVRISYLVEFDADFKLIESSADDPQKLRGYKCMSTSPWRSLSPCPETLVGNRQLKSELIFLV